MKNIIDDVRKYTPKYIPGYNYLKTQQIYIPFVKITIECLTRRISELNLFFECILKLIDISVKDINDIASILGVTDGIVKEAIIDMVSMDYVYVSENILGITLKGMDALKSKKRVDIQKTYLKDIMIDTITGEVYDADAVKTTKVNRWDVFLESIVPIDSIYLESNFQEINNIYQQQQKKNSIFGDSVVNSELYKIIKISYSELQYIENKVYMYKSDISNELIFELLFDKNDIYKNKFYNQLKEECCPCQENFFEKSRDLVNKIKSKSVRIEQDIMEQTEIVRKQIFTENLEYDIIIDSFTKRRYALNDHEYMSYLYNFKSLRYEKIFVCSDNLKNLLSNSFCAQLNTLATNIPIFIIYHKDEYNVDKSLHHFFKNKNANLFLIPSDTINENVICFDSKLIMFMQENIIAAFERPIRYMLPICDFDKNNVKALAKDIIERYNLNVYLEKVATKNSTSSHRYKNKKRQRSS